MTTTADAPTTAGAPTTATHGSGRPATDPIDLEVVRSRLEAIGEQAALAVDHTAISPTITESKDFSVTIMDPQGDLIVGAGMVLFHFGAASYSVKATIARFGDTVAPGDVFFANDPHNGGGSAPAGRHDPTADLPRGRSGRMGRAVGPHDGHGGHGRRLLRATGHRVLPGGDPLPGRPPVPPGRGDDRRLGHPDQQHPHVRHRGDGPPRTRRRLPRRPGASGGPHRQHRPRALHRQPARHPRIDRSRDATADPRPGGRRLQVHLMDRVRRRVLRDPLHLDGRRRPHDSGFRRRLGPDGSLLQLQAVHHCGRVPGDAGPSHRPRPAVQRRHLRPGRIAMPRGDRRQRQPARAHCGRPHACRAERSRRGHAGVQPRSGGLAGVSGPALPGRSRLRVGAGQQPLVLATARRLDRRLPRLRRQLGRRLGRAASATAWTSGATRWASTPKGSIADIEILESWYPLLFTERRAATGRRGRRRASRRGRDTAQPASPRCRPDQRNHVRHAPLAAPAGHGRRVTRCLQRVPGAPQRRHGRRTRPQQRRHAAVRG